MAGFRRVRGIRSRLPTGVIIGRRTLGTGKAEMLSMSEFGAALAAGAPASIPPAGGGGTPLPLGLAYQVLAWLGGTPTWADMSTFIVAGTGISVTGTTTVTISATGTTSGPGGGGMLPLVTGDLPGPVLVADDTGQCIGVPL